MTRLHAGTGLGRANPDADKYGDQADDEVQGDRAGVAAAAKVRACARP